MKNFELFKYTTKILQYVFNILMLAEIKQSDLHQTIVYLNKQTNSIRLEKDRVVHWPNHLTSILTSATIELTWAVMALGREVNLVRTGQRLPMKDFYKEAIEFDRLKQLEDRRQLEEDHLKGVAK
jgi:hypothetical protein